LELPPGRWERTWASFRRSDVLLRIGLAIAAALLICLLVRGWDPPFVYRAGQVPLRPVTARVSFEAVNPADTATARERARRQVPATYVNDPEPMDRLVDSLETAVRDVLAAESFTSLDLQHRGDFRFQGPPDAPPSPSGQEGAERFERFRQALAGDKDLAAFHKAVTAALAPFRERGVLGNNAEKPTPGGLGEIVVYPVGQFEAKKTVKLSDVQIGEGKALRKALQDELAIPALSEPVFDWLWRRMATNFSTLSRDDDRTRRAVENALANVPEVIQKFHEGDTLVQGASPLTSDQVRLLRLEYEGTMAHQPVVKKLGRAAAMVGLILALFALAAFYLYRYERRLLVSTRRLAGMLGLATVTIVLSLWASTDALRAELIPILLFGQIVAIAYRQELALLLSGVVAMILAYAIGNGMVTFLLLLGVTVAAVLQINRIRSRSKLIYVSVPAAVVAFLLTVILAVLHNQPLGQPLWILAACNALWTLAAGLLISGMLPFVEIGFGVLTDLSLLELGDVSHPLLQELIRRAPSTYNHSITVGSIAEAAAESIGARGLLARVGAYYHDIGKMLKPGYFIENQSLDGNRHESLVPAMSTLVIIAHIKDGSDLARQHKVPEPIIDLIEQHHGTTLVEYFYGRANEQAAHDPNGSEVEESLYRYPGPKPQTKEAGVLMLADAVESASRTLIDPTPARIESLVREIAERKLDDGQFDESGLTLRELRAIENSMIKSLIANYHGRVKYPEKPIPARAN
jgi:putative nucleotidyltransferase with HDIG domain